MTEELEILVEAKSVSKKFSRDLKRSLIYGLFDIFKTIFGINKKNNSLRKTEFWAVKDVSFQLRRGECLGLIGHNGAGKSTLLKMLNGLIVPNGGEITMKGRIGALIELGAGFNPILTGRENIYINGQILGFTKAEIDSKLEAIIDFSEIREFIDMPVQNYSSGMKVRLGFAVAAQMEPDVLIIDEVLAVGDTGFKLKCFDVIDNMMKNTAIIFVSHSMPMVSRICSKIILMDKGTVKHYSENISEGINLYYSRFADNGMKVTFQSNEFISLISLSIISKHRLINSVPIIDWNTDLKFNIKFTTSLDFNSPVITLYFLDKEQRPIAMSVNEQTVAEAILVTESHKEYSLDVLFEKFQFSMGTYFVTFGLAGNAGSNALLRVRNAISFQVNSKKHVWQTLELNGIWENSEIQNK